MNITVRPKRSENIDDSIWVSEDGRRTEISKLHTKHLYNIIVMIRGNIDKELTNFNPLLTQTDFIVNELWKQHQPTTVDNRRIRAYTLYPKLVEEWNKRNPKSRLET